MLVFALYRAYIDRGDPIALAKACERRFVGFSGISGSSQPPSSGATEQAASREQDSGAQQIARAIAQLDSVIQHNAALSEEFSTTSEQIAGQSALVASTAAALAAQAADLAQFVDFFRPGDQASQ